MQLRPFSLVSVFIWKLSSGHFQMLFHGQPNSECLKPKAVTFFTKHSSECLSQWHPSISLLKYFLNLSSHCCGDYQYPIQILILLYHSKYWNSLLNNFSTACSLQIHPHSWLPFPFLKPFNIVLCFHKIMSWFSRLSDLPHDCLFSFTFAFSASILRLHTKQTAYSCPYAVLFLPLCFDFMWSHAFFQELFSSK